MDERAHLHDGEILLASLRASPAALIRDLFRGLIEGLVFGAVIAMVLAFGITALGWSFGLPAGVVGLVVGVLIVLYKRWHLWHETKFRVTTERILAPEPGPLFHPPLHTIKWPQYQESHVAHRSFLDAVFFARPIAIRYGTADAHREVHFPSLRYGEDLKHFLDKVDSSVRRGDVSALHPFVAKPRGKRD